MIVTIDGNIPSKFAHSMNIMKTAQAFAEIGENVELVTLQSLPLILNRLKLGKISKNYGLRRQIPITRFSSRGIDFWTKSKGGKGYYDKMSHYITAKSPNFVYTRDLVSANLLVKAGVRVIAESHSISYDDDHHKNIFSIAKDDNLIGFVTIHQEIADNYVKRGFSKTKILVAEDAVDLPQFQINDDKNNWRRELGLPQEKTIVMYTGHLYEEKGIPDLLETASKVAKKDPDIEFVLVGGWDKDRHRCEDYVEDHEINNVRFEGFVPNTEVPKYLKAADVLIMPYNLQKFNYSFVDVKTTSPLKLFEYLAAKRPIISTAIETIEKIITHRESALLAASGDTDQLAEYVIELSRDKNLRQQLSANGFKIAETHTWQNRCQQMLDKFVK